MSVTESFIRFLLWIMNGNDKTKAGTFIQLTLRTIKFDKSQKSHS